MICRACLRTRSALARLPTSVLRAGPGRMLQAAAASGLRHQSLPPRPLHEPALRRLFATSPPAHSAAEAPQPSAAGPEKPTYLSEGESQVWDILMAEFAPAELVVQDISGGCGSMYGIEISSEKFRGLNMLKQQRLVNAALGDLMKEWHGVQLKTRVP